MATTKPDPFPPAATLAEVGEFALIDALVERFETGEHVFLGPGDDAAVVRTPRGHVVVSTDVLVEGRHFRRDWVGAVDVGHRAAAANLADVSAMGGVAHTLVVGVAAPGSTPAAWVLDLADGIAEEAAGRGASVVGGDLTGADQVVVAITVMGSCELAPVRRSGARPGDVVALAGRQGWAAAGLAVLKRGFRSPRLLVDAFCRPDPPYDAGPVAARAGATAMIDVSDGLVADLGHVAAASGVRIELETSAFELAEPMRAVGSALGVDPMQFVLGGGEDHSLAATFAAGVEPPPEFRVIGRVLHADGVQGPRVTVDGAAYDGPAGWSHF